MPAHLPVPAPETFREDRERALATGDIQLAATTAHKADALADVARRALGRTTEARPYVVEALRCRWTYAQVAGPNPGKSAGGGDHRSDDARSSDLNDGLEPKQRERWRRLNPLKEAELEAVLAADPDELPSFHDLLVAVGAVDPTPLIIYEDDDEDDGPDDEWYTPRWLFEQLDLVFDVDVCAPEDQSRRTAPAHRYYTEADDGLAQPWTGLIWCNPPYSTPAPWIHRWADHDNGLILTHFSVTSRRMPELWAAAHRIRFFAGMWFDRPDGSIEKPYYGLQLAARGATATEALRRVENEWASPTWKPIFT